MNEIHSFMWNGMWIGTYWNIYIYCNMKFQIQCIYYQKFNWDNEHGGLKKAKCGTCSCFPYSRFKIRVNCTTQNKSINTHKKWKGKDK